MANEIKVSDSANLLDNLKYTNFFYKNEKNQKKIDSAHLEAMDLDKLSEQLYCLEEMRKTLSSFSQLKVSNGKLLAKKQSLLLHIVDEITRVKNEQQKIKISLGKKIDGLPLMKESYCRIVETKGYGESAFEGIFFEKYHNRPKNDVSEDTAKFIIKETVNKIASIDRNSKFNIYGAANDVTKDEEGKITINNVFENILDACKKYVEVASAKEYKESFKKLLDPDRDEKSSDLVHDDNIISQYKDILEYMMKKIEDFKKSESSLVQKKYYEAKKINEKYCDYCKSLVVIKRIKSIAEKANLDFNIKMLIEKEIEALETETQMLLSEIMDLKREMQQEQEKYNEKHNKKNKVEKKEESKKEVKEESKEANEKTKKDKKEYEEKKQALNSVSTLLNPKPLKKVENIEEIYKEYTEVRDTIDSIVDSGCTIEEMKKRVEQALYGKGYGTTFEEITNYLKAIRAKLGLSDIFSDMLFKIQGEMIEDDLYAEEENGLTNFENMISYKFDEERINNENLNPIIKAEMAYYRARMKAAARELQFTHNNKSQYTKEDYEIVVNNAKYKYYLSTELCSSIGIKPHHEKQM